VGLGVDPQLREQRLGATWRDSPRTMSPALDTTRPTSRSSVACAMGARKVRGCQVDPYALALDAVSVGEVLCDLVEDGQPPRDEDQVEPVRCELTSELATDTGGGSGDQGPRPEPVASRYA
jgi:hypothetical protein